MSHFSVFSRYIRCKKKFLESAGFYCREIPMEKGGKMVKIERRKKIKQLYELYEQPLYRIAYAVLHNVEQAEDAVSEAFIIAIKNLDDIDLNHPVKTKNYMVRIIQSTAIDIYRSNAKKLVLFTPLNEEIKEEKVDSKNLEASVEAKIISEKILEQLAKDEQDLIMMRYYEDMSWNQIGEQLHISAVTARKRFERIRKKLICNKEEWL